MENIGEKSGELIFKLLKCSALRTYVDLSNIDRFLSFYTLFMSIIRASNSSLGTKDLFLIRVL